VQCVDLIKALLVMSPAEQTVFADSVALDLLLAAQVALLSLSNGV